ncbi:MAG: pantetheine-phosphate adenylyltransferase [Dehalococcoidia bacterium]|nr:pantetheine-phosphate adenylyltransferase [Dehalococcoidia bacterium]NOQ43322.1 pantetheine-phosphate adenylyltransferase [Dehalococcoidia bacterium]
MTLAIYPGSFDPVTMGHVDIAERAAALFEQLIVAVYDDPPKALLFTVEERVGLMEKALAHVPNIRVEYYSGLTVEFARKNKASAMVRGLRMISDFEREFEMALMNQKLAPEIELVCFMTRLEFEFVSSSLLKEAAKLGGCIDGLVPEHVIDALKEKYR